MGRERARSCDVWDFFGNVLEKVACLLTAGHIKTVLYDDFILFHEKDVTMTDVYFLRKNKIQKQQQQYTVGM